MTKDVIINDLVLIGAIALLFLLVCVIEYVQKKQIKKIEADISRLDSMISKKSDV